jgi:hypothetical protein
MRKLVRHLRRNLIAYIALFVALSGTSYAAASKVLPPRSVGTRQLRNNAVTTPKIKNGSVTGAKVRVAGFPKVPSAASADSATNATNATHATSADHAVRADLLGSESASGFELGGGSHYYQPFSRFPGTFTSLVSTPKGTLDLLCSNSSAAAVSYHNATTGENALVGYDDGTTNWTGLMKVPPTSESTTTTSKAAQHSTWLLEEIQGGRTIYEVAEVFFDTAGGSCSGVVSMDVLNR